MMKTPLANRVVNIFSNYTAAVTSNAQAIAADVNNINGSIQQKDGDMSESEYGNLVQQSRSRIQAGSKTQTNNTACKQDSEITMKIIYRGTQLCKI